MAINLRSLLKDRMKLLFMIGVMAISIIMLILAQQARALTEQEQIDRMTQSAKETESSLHSFLSQVKACTSLSDSKNKTEAAMDPRVRDCLKKNMGWDDKEIDMRYAIKR